MMLCRHTRRGVHALFVSGRETRSPFEFVSLPVSERELVIYVVSGSNPWILAYDTNGTALIVAM